MAYCSEVRQKLLVLIATLSAKVNLRNTNCSLLLFASASLQTSRIVFRVERKCFDARFVLLFEIKTKISVGLLNLYFVDSRIFLQLTNKAYNADHVFSKLNNTIFRRQR